MDLERTMQFIVDTLADVAVKQQMAEVRAQRAEQRMDRAEQRMDRTEQRMDRTEQRMDRTEQRMDKIERNMKGIQTLVKVGMKLVIDVQKTQKVTNQKLSALTEKMAELAESQKDTDRKFNNWLESMRSNGHKGSNGNRKKPN